MLRTFLTFAILGGPLSADEWPQFRGANGQGVIDASNVPVKIDFDKNLVWETSIPGKGWSSPVMSEGLVVVTTAVGLENIELRVIAMDFETGKIVWDQLVFEPTVEEAGVRHAKNSLASSTPFISDGVVYAHFGHMGTAALSLKSGKVVWQFHQTYPSKHGNGGSPVVIDGMLIFTADGEEKALLRGLDAKTGKLVWEIDREKEVRQKFSFGTPVVVPGRDGPLVVSQGSGMVGAYQAASGKLVWSVDYGEGFSVVPRPVVDDGFVYVTTGFGLPNLLAISLEGAEGDVTKTHVKWRAKRDIPKTPSFVISGDLIYLVDDTGRLSCLEKESGERLWMEPLMRNVSASLTLVEDRLYTFTEEGIAFVHQVGRDGAVLLAENDFKEPVFASPVVADNTLIVRSQSRIRRFSRN